MNKNIEVEKEALQRQLEIHLNELCDDVTKDINIISSYLDVTSENFTCMTYVGESLESLKSAALLIMEYILTVKTAEKMISKLPSFEIKDE